MENGFWFALLTITLAIIGWGINKYIEPRINSTYMNKYGFLLYRYNVKGLLSINLSQHYHE